MFNKEVDNYPHALEFYLEYYKTHEMCYRAVHRWFFVFEYIPDPHKSQEICDIVVSLYYFLIVHCPDKY